MMNENSEIISIDSTHDSSIKGQSTNSNQQPDCEIKCNECINNFCIHIHLAYKKYGKHILIHALKLTQLIIFIHQPITILTNNTISTVSLQNSQTNVELEFEHEINTPDILDQTVSISYENK
ncbi:hypothetical protein DERF_014571 [Dermatophagoides farinae]|uniref:Uncharacterized protein n=1 Tax=Dermatophagoides farinae TaxID=6954 RepID=A0A922HPC7_DERFA|nr:hypothetical protein DERF_014548 [Dermatophagoides farinae]KAH9493842.1 hypothetical protein DERF_014571 [Dermatophagoides farinae]